MRFGFLLFATDLQAVGPLARLGEEAGFDLVGLADAPALLHDPYMALTMAALQTRRVRLGPTVTNPQTRHPLVLANLAASLEALAPERSFLGLGIGNAGVSQAGARRATLAELAESVGTLRQLVAGESVQRDGAALALKVGPKRPVPIMLAGSGPRSLRLAGQLADLVFIAVGAAPEAVAEAIGWVHEGVATAGREPAEVECWAYIDAAVAEERRLAVEEVMGAAVARANIVFRGPALERVEAPLQEPLRRLMAGYDYSQHMLPGRTSNYRLAESLGLADYLLERFTIAGTPAECGRHLERLQATGLAGVCFNLSTCSDVPRALRLLGREVLPHGQS